MGNTCMTAGTDPVVVTSSEIKKRQRVKQQSYSHLGTDYDIVGAIEKGSAGKIMKVKPTRITCHTTESCSSKNSECGDYDPLEADDRFYALKELHEEHVTNVKFRNEMKNEIDLLQSFAHPNIPKIFNVYQSRESSKISMVISFYEGGDLYTRFPYQESEVALITQQLTEVVWYLHTQGVIHRDIKLENIVFASNDRTDFTIKLIDFGLATNLTKLKSKKEKLARGVGTTYSMAPEVLYSDKYSFPADMWSIGVVSFNLIAQDRPFYSNDRAELGRIIRQAEYDMTAPAWKKISVFGKNFIDMLLVANPSKRMTAEQALQHSWLKQVKVDESVKKRVRQTSFTSDTFSMIDTEQSNLSPTS